MQVYRNISLKNFNTLKIEAEASFLIDIEKLADLNDFCASEYSKIKPLLFLGGGSNVLFTKDYKGVILHSALKDIEKTFEDENEVWLRVGSGLEWDKFVEYCVSVNLGGVENLSDIPGNVGSSPVQNIGAYGVEAKDCIVNVEAFDISNCKVVNIKNRECRFGYRTSVFKDDAYQYLFITYVTFRLKKHAEIVANYGTVEQEIAKYPGRTIQNMRKAIIQIRHSKLPDEIGSAGSFFKNPVILKTKADKLIEDYPKISYYEQADGFIKIPAAWLIENTGLKGYRIGEVGTYEKQPLVIVNYGQATGNEIVDFSRIIQQKVFEKFGIKLEPEVCFI